MATGMRFTEVMERLKAAARPEQLAGMARYGLTGDRRLGVSMPDIRKLAKEIKLNHELALKLWETGIPDAMILAAIVDDPKLVTREQTEEWVVGIGSWDVCDQLCMKLDKVSFADELVEAWSAREEEFVKRAAYALIACMAWHDKTATDERFIGFLDVIKAGATDERNFVKKAVNWALRHIGKRNRQLNTAALKTA
ncbi:MAG: DNA alkylation repair protein, partial [Actinomycetota bacterium]